MIVDKEDHKAILLELIEKAHFPGAAARKVVELLDAIEAATVNDGMNTERKVWPKTGS